MNTRIRKRAVVAQVAPPVENTPTVFGNEFDEPYELNHFNYLKNRESKSTNWASPIF
jgi:hypothetical protein